ncbi:trypsin-like serine protease [Microvirga sp. W0021]|uniref:Trypsin-like serine protease n=1 Tax=Hohaiivirga grylli TaxID=3133970 RepID=A0ABV0BJI0_9HYPH
MTKIQYRLQGMLRIFKNTTFILLAWSSLSIAPASTLTGGSPAPHLQRNTVMILKSNGGVCSGLVVAHDVVLSAAHCASGADQFRIHYRDRNSQPVMLEPSEKRVHPRYIPGAVKARKASVDLALFRLSNPLPSDFSSARLSSRHPTEGERITIAGFGVSQNGNPRSMGTLNTLTLTVREPYGPGRLLIWEQAPQGTGICSGDSGGPQLVDDKVFAITAWAEISKTSLCGSQAQGILLGPQRVWIEQTMARWGRTAQWAD